jgi:hypothetical protein
MPRFLKGDDKALIDCWSIMASLTAKRTTALIGLAVPGRPIGPWSRRTGAPQASATGRDRSPPVHGGYTQGR